MKDLLDLYNSGNTFRDQVKLDLEDGAVWFDPDVFGAMHDINGVKVLSVFAMDKRGQTFQTRANTNEIIDGVSKSRGILFVRSNEIEGVRADQSLFLDGRLYLVMDAKIIQNCVWRIVLEGNES